MTMDSIEHDERDRMPENIIPTYRPDEFNDEDAAPSVTLEREIDVNALLSDKGTDFQIKDCNVDVTNDENWEVEGDFDEDFDGDEPDDVSASLKAALDGDTDAELTPFQRLAQTMTDITEDASGKVTKKILRAGVGPVVPERSIVRVFYSGRLEYSEEPFDSTYLQSKNRPRSFKLGDAVLVSGLDLAISSMRREEICLVLIHPDYFMGRLGCPPRIPPNATVLFRIELVSFSDRSGVHDYYDLPMSERKEAPLDTILQVVRIEKDEAKKFFKEKRYRQALSKYRRVINILEDCHLADAEAESKQQEELVVLYRNAAASANKLSEANRTIGFANQAIRINPKDCKAWFLKGKGLTQQSEFDLAKDAFMKAKRLQPNNVEITDALKDLDRRFKQFSLMEANTCKRMFSNADKIKKENSSSTSKSSPRIVDDPLQDVSEEFAQNAKKQLLLFKENEAMSSLPFPSSRHTSGEIKCLVAAAKEIGLVVQEVGEGTNHHYRFSK